MQNCGPKAFSIGGCEEGPPPRNLGVLPKNPLGDERRKLTDTHQ